MEIWCLNLGLKVMILIIFILTISSVSGYIKDEYTDCIDDKCTYTSNPRFILEDDKWVPVADAKSIKSLYQLTFLENDPRYNVDILDYSYNSISYCLESDVSITPIKIFGETDENITETYFDGSSFGANLIKRCYTTKLRNSIIGKTIKFGSASTVLTIDSTNIEDTYVLERYPTSRRYGNTQFKTTTDHRYSFNEHSFLRVDITDIPDNAIIESAVLNLTLQNRPSLSSAKVTLQLHHVYNHYDLPVSQITWVNKPIASTDYNTSNLDTELFTTQSQTRQSYTFNITKGVIDELDLNSNSLGIYLDSTSTYSYYRYNYVSFYSTEYSTVYRRPNVVVTYTLDAVPSVSIDLNSPENDNVSSENSMIFNVTAYAPNSDLDNVTLYHNISGTWSQIQTKSVSGVEDSETFTVNNIPNNIKYIWNVQACNNASMCSFATNNYTGYINLTDVFSPNRITDLTNTSTDDGIKVDLTWTNPTEPDYSYALIYRNGTNIANVTQPTATYSVVDNEKDTSYNFTVLVSDAFDNINYSVVTNENSIIVTTSPGDVTPPIITELTTPTNESELSYDTTLQRLQIKTDEVATCKFDTIDQAYADMTYTMTALSSSRHRYNNYPVSFGNSYTIYYRCQDDDSNTMTASVIHHFNVSDNTDPTLSLVTPENQTTSLIHDMEFQFIPYDDHTIDSCELYLNLSGSWMSVVTDNTITPNTYNIITKYQLSNGNYLWGVKCTDDGNQIVWSNNRTIIIDVPEPSHSAYTFLNVYDQTLFEVNSNGSWNFPSGSGTIVGDLLVTGRLDVLDDTNPQDLILIGTSETEFYVGTRYIRGATVQTGCGGYVLSGDYTGNETFTYAIQMDTSLGTEVGVAKFNWNDNTSSNFFNTGYYTSDDWVSLSRGVKIKFTSCDGLDFADGDFFEFDALEEPFSAFVINTDTGGVPLISSQAEWNFSDSYVEYWGYTFIDNLTVNQIVDIDSDSYIDFNNGNINIQLSDSNLTNYNYNIQNYNFVDETNIWVKEGQQCDLNISNSFYAPLIACDTTTDLTSDAALDLSDDTDEWHIVSSSPITDEGAYILAYANVYDIGLSNIVAINWTYEGRDSNTDVRGFVWNFTKSNWSQITNDSTLGASDTTIQLAFDTNESINDIINSSGDLAMAFFNIDTHDYTGNDHQTDFIELDVTYINETWETVEDLYFNISFDDEVTFSHNAQTGDLNVSGNVTAAAFCTTEGCLDGTGGPDTKASTIVICANNSYDTSVCDYVCDGIDDEVEINNAINLLSSTGGKVKLMEGIYNTYTQYGITIQNTENIILEGSGAGTIIHTENTTNPDKVYPIVILNSNYTTVRDLTVDGGYGGIFSQDSREIIITNNYIKDGYTGIASAGFSSTGIHISNNVIDNCTFGLYFWYMDGSILSSNTVYPSDDVGSLGVFVLGGENNQIINNRFISTNNTASVIEIWSNGTFVSNNIIEGGTTGIVSDYTTNSINNMIINNFVTDVTGTGIYSSSDNTIITNNRVDNATIGIHIDTTAAGNMVQGNNLLYSTTTILNQGTNTTIIGNYPGGSSMEIETADGQEIKMKPEGELTAEIHPGLYNITGKVDANNYCNQQGDCMNMSKTIIDSDEVRLRFSIS